MLEPMVVDRDRVGVRVGRRKRRANGESKSKCTAAVPLTVTEKLAVNALGRSVLRSVRTSTVTHETLEELVKLNLEEGRKSKAVTPVVSHTELNLSPLQTRQSGSAQVQPHPGPDAQS